MTERDLDLLLQRTAASMPYPTTPQLRARVLTSISDVSQTPSPAKPSPAPGRPAFAFAAVAAAVVALAAMLALAIPTSRTAIADFFGIEGSSVERLPTPAPGTTPTPLPTPQELPETARPATLAQAQVAIGFAPALVDGDAPASSHLVNYAGEEVAILRYPAFDLWQSELESIVAQKEIGEGTRLEELTLASGTPARWVTGERYVLVMLDENDEAIDGSFRVIERSTLIWRTERAFYRLETTLTRDEAIAIAETLP